MYRSLRSLPSLRSDKSCSLRHRRKLACSRNSKGCSKCIPFTIAPYSYACLSLREQYFRNNVTGLFATIPIPEQTALLLTNPVASPPSAPRTGQFEMMYRSLRSLPSLRSDKSCSLRHRRKLACSRNSKGCSKCIPFTIAPYSYACLSLREQYFRNNVTGLFATIPIPEQTALLLTNPVASPPRASRTGQFEMTYRSASLPPLAALGQILFSSSKVILTCQKSSVRFLLLLCCSYDTILYM